MASTAELIDWMSSKFIGGIFSSQGVRFKIWLPVGVLIYGTCETLNK